jgi:hypothetical protein
MCYYNQNMVQVHDMQTNNVTMLINNVWTRDAIPEQLRVFIHTNGIDAILDKQDGDGFQCLDTDGADIDIEGNYEFTIQCHQASDDAPWLAVIDVVITDDAICASNDVPHPCFPDGDPILESCSWRIVVPCSEEALCTKEPTSSPTGTPTNSPTESSTDSPTDGPTATPIASPTITPTGDPTSDFVEFGDDDDDGTIYFPPVGPEECPADVLLVKQEGITDYPKDTVQVVSQDTTTVTIEITQTYTDSTSTIDMQQFQQTLFGDCWVVH